MNATKRMGALALLISAIALLVAALSPAASMAGHVQQRGSCGYQKLGSTYVTSIKTKNVGCSTGRSVSKKFTNCRKKHGAKGHCRSRVKHYRCKERRYDKNQFQYSSKVNCKRGGRRVNLTYTQNT